MNRKYTPEAHLHHGIVYETYDNDGATRCKWHNCIYNVYDSFDEPEDFNCPAAIYHGPGHQSRTLCTRRDVHDLDDEHYAPDPMEPGFSWTGERAYDE